MASEPQDRDDDLRPRRTVCGSAKERDWELRPSDRRRYSVQARFNNSLEHSA